MAELKKLRLELAKGRSVPAFVIFSDKTLIQMADEMPTTESQFLSINGVGKKKIEEFYGPFSRVIASHMNEARKDEKPTAALATSGLENEEAEERIYSTPAGNYYKIEEQSSFSPLSARASKDFVDDLQKIYRMRTENVEIGRMINYGMPFSEEERDDLAKRFSCGQTIEALSDFFQRTTNSIEIRLEELELINHEDTDEDLVPNTDELRENAKLCEACGEPIPLGRLEIMPNTRVCVQCKECDENIPDRGVVFPSVPSGLAGYCPRCGVGIAVVYQNHTDKNFFVGCSSFPSCRWSKEMD